MVEQNFAVVFPGQGSQSVGMLQSIALKHAIIQNTFVEASQALGYDLWSLTQNGPAEQLNQTEYTQPALLAAGVALWRLYFEDKKSKPRYLAGHSLGEYTALVCAGSLSFTDALKIVALRGRLMQKAVPEGVGAMAAILGLTDEEVVRICEEVSDPSTLVSAANFNTVGQVVISGHREAVGRAMESAKACGAKRTLLLPVSVPSHCALMKPAAIELDKSFNDLQFKLPFFPVIHNSDVCEHPLGEDIRRALVEQLCQPVRWVESIQLMAGSGVKTIYECGPGAVLTGLNKRIESSLNCVSLSVESMNVFE